MALARIRTVFAGVPGTPWYSNMYFQNDGGTSIATSATTWVTAFWTAISPSMAPGITWTTDPEVPTFNQLDGKITKTDAVTPGTGTASGADQALPYSNQALIRLLTNQFVNGRRVRGRIFVPGMREVDNTSGLPSPALRTVLGNAATALITSGTGTLAVWARPFNPDPPDPLKPARLGSQHAVQTAQVWTQWSVLRSRRD